MPSRKKKRVILGEFYLNYLTMSYPFMVMREEMETNTSEFLSK
jgi:hypothetical protein